VSVTSCAIVRFTWFHLHKVPEGLPSYILRTGSGRPDGRDVYGVIKYVLLIVVFGVGTQLPRRPVMTRRPNAWAGGGVLSFSSEVHVRQGRVPLPCKFLLEVRAPNSNDTTHRRSCLPTAQETIIGIYLIIPNTWSPSIILDVVRRRHWRRSLARSYTCSRKSQWRSHKLTVRGPWHWTLVQGPQRQEGPKR